MQLLGGLLGGSGSSNLLGQVGGQAGNTMASGMNMAAGYYAAKAAKEAARKARAALMKGYAESEALMAERSQVERERMLKAEAAARRKEALTLQKVRERAEAAVYSTVTSTPYRAQAQFLLQQFREGIPAGLAAEYAGRIRTAQSARGLARGGAASQNEAALLSKMAYEQRMQLLPQLRQLALDPLQLQIQAEQSGMQLYGGAQQMGLNQLQAQMGAAQTSQQIASMYADPLIQARMSAALNMPYSAASPIAMMLAAAAAGMQQSGQAAQMR